MEKDLHIKKALDMIESEMKNIELIIKYPDAVKSYFANDNLPDLDFDISGNDLIEMTSAIHAAKIAFKQGKDATFIDIERYLEAFFKKEEIKRPYNKKSRLPDRVSITPFLDKLKDSFIDDYNKKLFDKDKK